MSFDFVSPLLNLISYPALLLGRICSRPGLIFSSSFPDRLVGLGVFLQFADEVVEVLLLLLSVF